MDNILRTEIGKSCIVYVDDILVFGKNEKEHDEALHRVKSLLKKKSIRNQREKIRI